MNLVNHLDKIEQVTSFDAGGCMNRDPLKIVLTKDTLNYCCVTTPWKVPFSPLEPNYSSSIKYFFLLKPFFSDVIMFRCN